jgi:NAD(P)-dependent dehydrogenase (short-subunit alcohol dehydrogenase family)
LGERLAGETAVVTGSTSGLGREIAVLFADEGCKVAVTGRNRERGAESVEAIRRRGGHAEYFQADLAEEDGCRSLVGDAAERLGPVTILVNNAVAKPEEGADGPVTEVAPATWHAILAVNLVAAATLCRFVIPLMLEAGHGSIVNVSSRAAELGTPGLAAYTASKAGLGALSRSITADFARQGIRCNTVQAGYVLHAERDAHLPEERRRRLADMQLTRMTTARDVAEAVCFLSSGAAGAITGANLRVDGGSTAVRARTFG